MMIVTIVRNDITTVGQRASTTTRNVQIITETMETRKLHLYISSKFSFLVTKYFITEITKIVGNSTNGTNKR